MFQGNISNSTLNECTAKEIHANRMKKRIKKHSIVSYVAFSSRIEQTQSRRASTSLIKLALFGRSIQPKALRRSPPLNNFRHGGAVFSVPPLLPSIRSHPPPHVFFAAVHFHCKHLHNFHSVCTHSTSFQKLFIVHP